VWKHDEQPAYAELATPDSRSVLVLGDASSVLAAMPSGCVQTVVTSPPYWSLRDYAITGQIGLEESVYEFIGSLADIFEQVRRLLRDDGTLWLNIGDSYTSGGRTWRAPDKKNRARAMSARPPTPEGLKPKDLIGVPWRLAFALQERGWYLRSDIIWNKPNCQPESVSDRPTRSHEYLFFFAKSERYKYDVRAVPGPNGRRLRSVWDLKTHAYPEANGHFATFPPSLVEPCLKITTEPGDLVLDPFAGSGTTSLTAARLGRRFAGIELHPSYLEMARTRLLTDGFTEALDGDGVGSAAARWRAWPLLIETIVFQVPCAPRVAHDTPVTGHRPVSGLPRQTLIRHDVRVANYWAFFACRKMVKSGHLAPQTENPYLQWNIRV
jgi:site-specific DNA-methyltransferase (cytosine-N4-specific)